MAKNIKKEVSKIKEVSYSNKDFNSLRNELQNYALTHFSDNIIDFSDASLGGLILDLGAYVGDTLMYYLDHQFNENSIERAVEKNNIERLIRESGTEIPSASPAFAEVDISIVVPAEQINGEYVPKASVLPIVKKNSIFSTPEGISFYLLEDIDFNFKDNEDKYVANVSIGRLRGDIPVNFVMTRKGIVSSSSVKTEVHSIPNNYQPFRTITLDSENINEIISVIDTNGDEYHQVDTLSQDTVFKAIENSRYDSDEVQYRLEMLHAPKRYVATRSINSGKTTLRFGSGSEDVYDEDVIPDPSEHAIKLYGDRKTFNTVTIDPNSFLTTQTLGISPRDTSLTVTYRYGGGISHNVSAGKISSVKTLITSFPKNSSSTNESLVRSSLTVVNYASASGGEDELTLEELRTIAILNRNSQNRIVTREDLIARVYSMPANFGRVFRVSVSDNPRNPLAAQLHIVSRDANKKLKVSSDTLKKNLSKYLNKFRLVSDSLDILDAIILNVGIEYSVTVQKGFKTDIVLGAINSKIAKHMNTNNFQINKPIVVGEIENIILNVPGVVSLLSFNVVSKTGIIDGKSYESYSFNVKRNIDRGYIFPPLGGIFEMRYPDSDIVGRAI